MPCLACHWWLLQLCHAVWLPAVTVSFRYNKVQVHILMLPNFKHFTKSKLRQIAGLVSSNSSKRFYTIFITVLHEVCQPDTLQRSWMLLNNWNIPITKRTKPLLQQACLVVLHCCVITSVTVHATNLHPREINSLNPHSTAADFMWICHILKWYHQTAPELDRAQLFISYRYGDHL